MKLIDAIAILDTLEESLNMLAKTRMQEMEMSAVAGYLRNSKDPGTTFRQVNLGNLTSNGQRLEGVQAVEAFDQALALAGAPAQTRTLAAATLKKFWREVNPSQFDKGQEEPYAVPDMNKSEPAPRVYGTKPVRVSQSAQSAINQVSPDERARLARKFQGSLAKKREQKRKMAHKSL